MDFKRTLYSFLQFIVCGCPQVRVNLCIRTVKTEEKQTEIVQVKIQGEHRHSWGLKLMCFTFNFVGTNGTAYFALC